LLLALVLLTALPCQGAQYRRELHFFCGSAVRVPMDEIVRAYRAERGVQVFVTYGGSGTLLAQMELSRRGDVYLSGSPDFISLGERKGLLVKGTERNVAYLVPSIIVPKGNPARVRTLADLARKDVRVGIGNPETVCLGLYAVELLEANSLLEQVIPRVAVFAKSCEDTATLVVLRKVDAVIGWDVFAAWNPREVEMIRIPGDKIPRLSYIAAAVPVFARDISLSEDFIGYVLSKKGKAILRKWHYIDTEREARRCAPSARLGGEYILPERYFKLIRHE
jgi:molybdate transport system substrate-binding protein